MKQIKENTVNLGNFLVDGEYSFTSRTRGIAVRTRSNIDQLIQISDKLHIIIPEGVYEMSRSFWKEFLGNAIMDLGKEDFYTKIIFDSKGRYQPHNDVCEVVSEICTKASKI